MVDVIEKYVKKGSKIYVEGELSTRKYQDKDGNDRYTTEVVLQGYNSTLTMLGSAGSSPQVSNDSSNSPEKEISSNENFESSQPDSSNMDDDIPF